MSAISALIIIIFILFIIASAVFGFKSGARRTAYGLAANLISALIAFIFSLLLKKPLSSIFYKFIEGKITGRLNLLSNDSIILTLTEQISISIASILLFICIYVALRCFYGLFLIVRAIYLKKQSKFKTENSCITDTNNEISKAVSDTSMTMRKLSASSLGGVIICTISFIISTVFVLFPLSGAVNCINSALEGSKQHAASSQKYSSIKDKISPFANNIVLDSVYSCGGSALFDKFTYIDYGDTNVSLSDETSNMVILYILFSVVRDESYANTPERIAAAESIKEVVNNSEVIPDLSAELLKTAANSFIEKESFMGMHLPDSNEKIKSLYLDMMNTCANTSSNSIKESLNSFIDIWETMIRYDAISRIKNNDTVLALFADDGFLEEFFLEIYDDSNLKTFIPKIANTGLSMAFESINLPSDSITDNAITIEGMSREDVQGEAILLTNVIKNINSISSSVQTGNSVESAELLNDTIDDLYSSHFFKQITQALLLSIITSYAESAN